ncbi:MAG: efflux RND transporter permease subunit [Myxococcaceae bacterium]
MALPSAVQSGFQRYVALSFRRPARLLLIFCVLGGAMGGVAARLDFRGSFAELLPKQTEEVADLELISKKAGGDGYLVLQVKGGDVERRRDFARALASRLESLPEVRYVEYRYSVAFFRERGLLLLPPERLRALRHDIEARLQYEKKVANPLYVDLTEDAPPPSFEALEKRYSSGALQTEFLESADKNELYLLVKPTGFAGDLRFAEKLLANVGRVVAELTASYPGLHVDTTGAHRIRIEEDAVMKRDVVVASSLAALIASGIILLSTRRKRALAAVALPVAVALAAAFGIAEVTIGYINVVTSFLVAILIGLSVEYGVHIAMRYFEERQGLQPSEALHIALVGTFPGAVTSAVTNGAAFLVLVFAKFEAFRQFGWIAATGVLMSLIAAYLVAPPVLALAERFRPMSLSREPVAPVPDRSVPLPQPLLLLLVSFALALGVASLMAMPVRFETDLRKLKGESAATRLDEHITAQLGVKITPAIVLAKSLPEAHRIAQLARAVQKRHGDERSAIQKVTSLNDFFPRDPEKTRSELSALGEQLKDLPPSVREGEASEKIRDLEKMIAEPLYGPTQVPLEIRRRFEALDGNGTFVLVFPRYFNYNTDEIRRWAEELDELKRAARAESLSIHILDGNLLAARIFELVYQDGPAILWRAALVVLLAIFISLRSVRRTLIVAGPLFLGMLSLGGALVLFDVRINFINGVVLPNLLAIAVDNSVHLYHRYQEEGVGSLPFILKRTGFAALVATLTNASGYATLLLAHHTGLRSISYVALLGVATTFFGTTFVFPAVLGLLERAGARRV